MDKLPLMISKKLAVFDIFCLFFVDTLMTGKNFALVDCLETSTQKKLAKGSNCPHQSHGRLKYQSEYKL